MKRAAIYARFSSEKQNDRSCQDQIDLCRAWAEREGWLIVEEYRDEAVSGASTVNRLGLGRLMRDAGQGAFDVVLCEALDRLSRDQADLATIRKQLTFREIGITTIADGEVGAIHVGLKGLMGELFLADLAQKTRRGQRARVLQGTVGGGSSYGYASVPGQPGQMTIVEPQAAVIQRIFAEYVAGRTPREIVADLNREGIPGPRSGHWNASTVNGSRERANGILQNRLYVGEIVWNRQRFIKDPATGKRISRPNPPAEWVVAQAPHLAIIEREVFEAAQARKASRSILHPVYAKRPTHLLSGLVRCAYCGSGYTIVNRDRLGCSGARERGNCDNRTTVPRIEVERRVLAALDKHLAAPEVIAEYVRAYHEEYRAAASANRSHRGTKQKRLDELTRSIARLVDALADGTVDAKIVGPKLSTMEAEAQELRTALAAIEADNLPITLHPGAAQKYARMVADLQAHMDGMKRGEPAERVIEDVRTMIEWIAVGPAPEKKKPATIEVHGLLAGLLSVPTGREHFGAIAPSNAIHTRRGKLVAGAGFVLTPTANQPRVRLSA